MKLRHLIFIAVLAIIIGASAWGVTWWRSGKWKEVALNQVGAKLVNNQNQLSLIHQLLGFDKEQTYLLLFLNNTELRPGGGFIGTYGVLKMKNGNPSLVKIEGTEILDYSTDNKELPAPPQPLKDYIKVDKWFFRDSNWSPDFRLSSEKSLELYKLERGVERNNITGVIGITPSLLQEILKITGPVVVRGQEINADNFLEKVEYEVEYGYAQKGIPKADRKSLLADLTTVMSEKLRKDVLLNWGKYYDLWKKMVAEKQVMFYSADKEMQNIYETENWAGIMKNTSGDYLLWADANLGALKTDLVVDRELSYGVKFEKTPTSTNYIATVSMLYNHHGGFDWRTSRYRTYARVYVPEGSKLISSSGAMVKEKSNEPGQVAEGVENGKKWFGAFVSIEPGKVGSLSFTYILPPDVSAMIQKGDYNLTVQKQLGAYNHNLHLDLDFGREVISAAPGEKPTEYGDSIYKLDTDLSIDRVFQVKLK